MIFIVKITMQVLECRRRNWLAYMYNVMGALHDCRTVKFDSCNNLISSAHTILVITLHSVSLRIKRKLLLLYFSIYIALLSAWGFQKCSRLESIDIVLELAHRSATGNCEWRTCSLPKVPTYVYSFNFKISNPTTGTVGLCLKEINASMNDTEL